MTRIRTVFLASLVVVAAVVAGIGTLAPVAAAEHVESSDRTVTTTATPGETLTVTTNVTLASDASRLAIEENFSSSFASVSNLQIDINGEGSVFTKPSSTDKITVALTDVTAGTTVQLTYTVTIPETATQGDTFVINGSVLAGGNASNIAPTTIEVVEAETTRSLSDRSITPGSSTTVTLTTTAHGDIDRLAINETIEGNVTSVSLESVVVNGSGTVQGKVPTTSGIDVAVSNLTAGSTVTVTYNLTVADHFETDSEVTLSGSLTFGNATISSGTTIVSVAASPTKVIAGEDSKVDTNELKQGITAWATKKKVGSRTVTTSDLQKLIMSWATNRPV